MYTELLQCAIVIALSQQKTSCNLKKQMKTKQNTKTLQKHNLCIKIANLSVMRGAIVFYPDFSQNENYSKHLTFDWVTNLFHLLLFYLTLL